jgi:phage terminase large subunit
MVRDLFGVTPDPWQEDVLEAFPREPKIAMQASKGPGKTCVLAWLAWNFLLTRPNPKIAATSISGANLADGLWTEMALWQGKSELLKSMFVWTKTRIFSREKPETWWMSARSWSQTADKTEVGKTLAGLHADYILFLLDESGGMPSAIMASAEAALASCKEGHIIQAGNPTDLDGPLYQACTTARDQWFVVEINGDPDNPKRSPRVDIEWARSQIRQYGRDNPYVLVNVLGKFPPAGFNTLIGPDEVAVAIRRHYAEHDYSRAARVLGVDVARQGDDSSVIFQRQGLVAFTPKQYRGLDGTQGAGLVARLMLDWSADATFIDDTGGFGSSWIDNLMRLGHAPIGVQFAGKADNPRYYNKRTEMAFDCVEWVKRGGAIPDCPELVAALTRTTYTHQGDRLLLEPKEQVKSKLGYSPDHLDALMLTFAAPVARAERGNSRSRHAAEYDPFASYIEGIKPPSGSGYNPFGG